MSKDIIRPVRSKFLRYLTSYAYFWQRKKIGFYANFGHGDLGDDGSFFVARDLLGEDVLPISKRSYAFNPHILKALLIGGGGTLRWESPYIPRRILTRDKWNFPVILFSAGLNQDYNREFTNETKDKIKRLCVVCGYLSVRDALSQRFIEGLGFSDVKLLPDLGLVLKEEPKEINFGKTRPTVGIVLTPHSEFKDSDFKRIIDIFSRFTDYLTETKKDVLYIPFETKDSKNTKEKEVIQEIMKNVRQKESVRVLENDIKPQEILFIIKNYCDIMICTRLHSAVFSTNAGVPFLCLSYNVMHDGFLEMLDAQDLGISIFNGFSFESLKNKFEYLLENYDGIKCRLIDKRGYLRRSIHKEIFHIREMIERRSG